MYFIIVNGLKFLFLLYLKQKFYGLSKKNELKSYTGVDHRSYLSLSFLYTNTSLYVEGVPKNTTQNELRFSMANHVKIGERLQVYENTTFGNRIM